jgi:hypothetical protein
MRSLSGMYSRQIAMHFSAVNGFGPDLRSVLIRASSLCNLCVLCVSVVVFAMN